MNKKCKHYYLNISRKLNVTHVTEVSVRYDEDEQYHESTTKVTVPLSIQFGLKVPHEIST